MLKDFICKGDCTHVVIIMGMFSEIVEEKESVLREDLYSCNKALHELKEENKRLKQKMKKAVYVGSFDPLTNGHLWMIEEGAKLFDEIVVTIGVNPDKKSMFSLEERIGMIKDSTKHIQNIKIDSFSELFLVDYMTSVEAQYSLRGIRSHTDMEYEQVMRNINTDLNSNIQTVFLIPPRELADISSTLIKGLVGPTGWENVVKRYVPEPVYKKFLEKFGKK